MNDPRVRSDGLCAECGKTRAAKRGAAGKAGDNAARIEPERLADPFCSSTCCRAFHGCDLDTNRASSEGGTVGGQAAAAKYRAAHGGRTPRARGLRGAA